MPQSKEEKAIYQKEYRANNKDKKAIYQREYHKDYYAKTKDKIAVKVKEYRAKNKDKIKARRKEYRANYKNKIAAYSKTLQCIKGTKISGWKRQGIIYDLEKLHYLYMNTHRCWVCKNKFKSSRDKCADHDHDINNGDNFRFILCQTCNNKDRWRKYIAANRIIKFITNPCFHQKAG
tara:strand:- start:19 stop:549 length:531 start_codon:yes stop_codon:yes gene_type:complete